MGLNELLLLTTGAQLGILIALAIYLYSKKL